MANKTPSERFAAMLNAMMDEVEIPYSYLPVEDEPDDWRKYDHVDHFAAADYWDEVVRQEEGQP